jgi:hypothetical protein
VLAFFVAGNHEQPCKMTTSGKQNRVHDVIRKMPTSPQKTPGPHYPPAIHEKVQVPYQRRRRNKFRRRAQEGHLIRKILSLLIYNPIQTSFSKILQGIGLSFLSNVGYLENPGGYIEQPFKARKLLNGKNGARGLTQGDRPSRASDYSRGSRQTPQLALRPALSVASQKLWPMTPEI